jgi:N-acetylglucosamine malate deacetylase 1
MKNKVLVVAAHPDDEILGCGATMAKHIAAGDEVHVLIMAEGLTSRSESLERDAFANELSDLKKKAQQANDLLGVTSIELFDFPDNRMDSVDRLDVIKSIEVCIEKKQPNIIYTHHCGDVNIDHRVIFEAVVTACRPQPDHCVKRLLSFEVNSSTEWQAPSIGKSFTPNWFEDVSLFIDKKIEALKVYESEMRDWPHSRSYKAVEALSRYRGASIGVDAAESFILIRHMS